MDVSDWVEMRKLFREARNTPELILKRTVRDRPDFAINPIKDVDVDAIAKRVREVGGLDIENPELVFLALDHGLIEPRPCAIESLWSACIFPLTVRGMRAIMMSEQSQAIANDLFIWVKRSTSPDWPLERKNSALVEEFARWKWVTLSRKKRTYELIDAINNDILFFDLDGEVFLPDDDVVLFRLRYEPPKVHIKV